jgi:triacylglycerol lipase
MGKKLELAIGVLNGAIGDYLVRTGNGLAIPMAFVHAGAPIGLAALARAHPQASGRVVVLVHGVMCTESIWDFPAGGDYGAFLARDLGYTPFYVRYNSGLPIADNGAALARLLDELIGSYPVPIEELVLVGYSMGGLVTRSACHVAAVEGLGWLRHVRRAIYVGTPHRGAPLERYGRVLAKLLQSVDDPYTQLFAQISNLRSHGIQDLGDADLRHEDRARRVVSHRLRDPQHPVPLLPGIRHYLIAGAISAEPWLTALFGDSIVPLASATNDEPLPRDHVHVLPGVSHIGLAHHAGAYERLRAWCEEKLP